jgi:hypothetical protein
MDIGGWLRSLGLERYEAAFRENEIDETVLASLTAEDLKDLGVGIVGHRRSYSMPSLPCAPMRTPSSPRLTQRARPPRRAPLPKTAPSADK